MLDLFQIMAEQVVDKCGGLAPIVRLIKFGVFPIIQIGIPIILILMGTIDLGKAVMSNDDKEIKGATGKLIKRAIMAVAVFFVVLLVRVVFGWLGKTGDDDIQNDSESWWSCWSELKQ